VNSMSDLFHEQVPDDYISLVAEVMVSARWHTYQVLTKRSLRMSQLLRGPLKFAASEPHIWWGVSVENRRHGLPRIKHLSSARPKVAFLSIEPLLEDLGELNLAGVSWVIVGGESGPGARPMKREWVLRIRDECHRARVPFFFKQWGGVRKGEAGRELEGTTYDAFPSVIANETPPDSVRLPLVFEFGERARSFPRLSYDWEQSPCPSVITSGR